MRKLFDNLIFTRMDIKFITPKQINKYANNYDWQIVQILPIDKWRENHILYATHLAPINFLNDFKEFINKNKNIILFGDWRRNVRYYRKLKHEGYKVCLLKQKGEDLWKDKIL